MKLIHKVTVKKGKEGYCIIELQGQINRLEERIQYLERAIVRAAVQEAFGAVKLEPNMYPDAENGGAGFNSAVARQREKISLFWSEWDKEKGGEK